MKRAGWLAILGLLILGGLLGGGRTMCPLPVRPRVAPPVSTGSPASQALPPDRSANPSR